MAKSSGQIADIEYIHQLVYDFRLAELQTILETVKQNKTGSKQCLRKRVLNLLIGPLTKTKALRKIIIQVYKSRPQQNQQNQQPQQQPQQQPPQAQFVPQPNYLQRYLRPPRLNYNTAYTQPRPNQVQPLPETPNPPIEFEHLPFYKTVHTLLMPMYCQTNINCANFSGLFYLTDSVRHSIVKSWNIASQVYKIQIILRLVQVGLQENVTERLPYNITVSVNERQCKLPILNIPTKAGITPWRCNVPIDITQQTDLRNCLQNTLKITWSEEPHEYMAGVYVAQKLTWLDLLSKLKKRPSRPSDLTKEFIKKSMESDVDMNIDSMIATVKDPLTKLRMELPARGKDCIHMQCFDALQFLQMNEQKQTWTCPICKKKLTFENIEVDDFFLNIVKSPDLSDTCENVILLKDGTWTEKKNKDFSRTNDCQSANNIEVVTIDDDDDTDVKSITDSDTDDEPPTSKRLKRNPPNIEQHVIKSEHIAEIEDPVHFSNYGECDRVLDLCLKNMKTPLTSTSDSSNDPQIITSNHNTHVPVSAESKNEPIIILNDDIDTPSSSSSSSINPRSVLDNYYLPNITISDPKTKESIASSSGSNRNNNHKEKDNLRPVLCVITLD